MLIIKSLNNFVYPQNLLLGNLLKKYLSGQSQLASVTSQSRGLIITIFYHIHFSSPFIIRFKNNGNFFQFRKIAWKSVRVSEPQQKYQPNFYCKVHFHHIYLVILGYILKKQNSNGQQSYSTFVKLSIIFRPKVCKYLYSMKNRLSKLIRTIAFNSPIIINIYNYFSMLKNICTFVKSYSLRYQ